MDKHTHSSVPGRGSFNRNLLLLRHKSKKIFFICYDITLLRYINSAYGHRAGDALLAGVSDWVREASAGILYRIEGDLYCLVLADVSQADAEGLMNRIEQRFTGSWPVKTKGDTLALYTSAALALVPDDRAYWNIQMKDLFERAIDLSRRERRSIVYSRKADRNARQEIALKINLRQSVLNGMEGFDVFFQPIADPVSGRWRGLESLCRWNSPTLGSIPPLRFIPLAEQLGLVHILDRWVMEQAVATCKRLELDALDDFFISVNISAVEIGRGGFADGVLGICKKYRFPCQKLVLEITESAEFLIDEQSNAVITRLLDAGIRFALDDFGTGFSAIQNMKRLPVHFVKTEREMLTGIEDDEHLQFFYYILSEAIHASGKKLITEGIETPVQHESVLGNGADMLQGYLFSKPIGAKDLAKMRDRFSGAAADILFKPQDSGIDLKRWLASNHAYRITPALLQLLNSCMNIVLREKETPAAFNKVLALAGNHFKVSHAYVFLQDEGSIFSNRFEWYAEGEKEQMRLLQQMDGATDGFVQVLEKKDIVIVRRERDLPGNLVRRLSEGGQPAAIQSFLALPMRSGNDIIGFVGMGDKQPRNWRPEEIIFLHNLCLLALIVLDCSKPAQDIPPPPAQMQDHPA